MSKKILTCIALIATPVCILAQQSSSSSSSSDSSSSRAHSSSISAPFQLAPPEFEATVKVPIEVLKASRRSMYSGAISQLLKDPKIADFPECTGDERWFSARCIKPAATYPSASTSAQSADQPAMAGKRYALLIANSNYTAPIPKLLTTRSDVSEVAQSLKTKFGYETTIVTDAGKRALVTALENLASKTTAADTVVVYYAGHGYLLDETGMGYWIPTDATAYGAQSWLSNTDISKLLSAIPAKQVLLVSDSCFSGSLTAEGRLTAGATLKTEDILKQRSVLAMSSGGNEPVSDEGKGGHSIFAWHFLQTLKNTKVNDTGTTVWSDVRKGVLKDYPQYPQYGAVMSAGHMPGGDYLLPKTP